MAGITFLGQLNPNELYSAIFNMIISQRIFDISVQEPILANRLAVDGTLYGDTKLHYSMDIDYSDAWGNDAEASSLLTLKRNTTQVVEAIVLDQFRQAYITIDNYLSKRAWNEEGSFSKFNGVLSASIGQIKKVFSNGFVNTYIGCHESTAAASNITIDITDLLAEPKTAVEKEAIARLTGQRISEGLANLFVELETNNTKFNELGYLRAYSKNQFLVVWNAQAKNKIKHIDLPMIFNNGINQPMDGISLDQKYFGTLNSMGGIVGASNKTIYCYKEGIYNDGNEGEDIRVRVGELMPDGVVYDANETYTIDPSIICKIIVPEGNPFMQSMEVGTSFFNSKSLTENYYLTWGFNTMYSLSEFPFITVRLSDREAVENDNGDNEGDNE